MSDIQLFTEAEAAKILRLSPVSLWRRRRDRKISYRRDLGKILYTKADLEEYINRDRQQASPAK